MSKTEVKSIVVSLRASIGNFRKKMAAASKSVKGFTRGVGRSAVKLAKYGGVAAVAAAAVVGVVVKAAVGAASQLEETMNKFNVVFGKNAEAVKAWGDGFAKQVGRSREQIASFMAGSQDLLVPLGFEPGAATTMSKQITGLAIDLASFNNLKDADVLRDLQAALTGSGEVMKKYGVIVSETAVKRRLLAKGMDPKNADDEAKALARLEIIMAGTTAAQGDAIRSAGSYANQMKGVKAGLADVAASLGTVLLPIATRAVTWIKGALGSFEQYTQGIGRVLETVLEYMGETFDVAWSIGSSVFEAIGGILESFGVTFTGTGDVVGSVLGGMMAFFRGFAAVTIKVFTFLEAVFVNWRDALTVVFKGALLGLVIYASQLKHFFTVVIPAYAAWFADNWRGVFRDLVNFTGTVFKNLFTNAKNLFTSIWSWLKGDGFEFKWTGLTDGFKASVAALPEIAKRSKGEIEKALALDVSQAANRIGGYYNEKVKDRLAKLNAVKTKADRDAAKTEAKSVAAVVKAVKAVKEVVKVPPRVIRKPAKKEREERQQDFAVLARGIDLAGLVGSFAKTDQAKKTADNTARAAEALERIEKKQGGVYFTAA